MIGKNQLQLSSTEIISGMASSDYADDGSLGTSSTGLNPFIQPGVMYALASPTDISTNVVGNIIASCEDSNAVTPQNRYLIDDSTNASNYYYDNGTAITKVKTGTSTGTTYVQGKSDFISYNGLFYASAPTVLNRWDGSTTLTEAFYTFTDGNSHHPMLVFEGLLFIGDGNILVTIGTGGTVSSAALSLNPKEKIVALGIDPQTGLMMISVQTVYDTSDTIPSLKAVYLWNGSTPKPSRKILVDDLITAFYNVEGIVYIGSGQTIGQWNGNGVTFLRKLKNLLFSNGNTDLPYKHKFSNTRQILHIVDGNQILSYGSVISGKKGFFYTAVNPSNSNHLTVVYPRGQERIAIGFSTGKLYSFDFSSAAAGSMSLYFNNLYFPRPITVHRIRVITTGMATSIGFGSVAIIDEKNNTLNTTPVSFLVNSNESPKYVFDFDFEKIMQGVQLRISMDTRPTGIVSVYIYYTPYE